MKIFKIVINKTLEEQKALIEVSSGNSVILMGDYYHDKISERIEGFLDGVSFCGVEYKLQDDEYISPEGSLFAVIGFYDDRS